MRSVRRFVQADGAIVQDDGQVHDRSIEVHRLRRLLRSLPDELHHRHKKVILHSTGANASIPHNGVSGHSITYRRGQVRLMSNDIDIHALPAHIAIIMDGNGRWAKKRACPASSATAPGSRTSGRSSRPAPSWHEGADPVRLLDRELDPPESEVGGLMSLLKSYLRKELADLKKNNIRLQAIGDMHGPARRAPQGASKTS